MSARPDAPDFLPDEAALRAVIPAPTERITAKIRPTLDATAGDWIHAARLVGLAVRRPDGGIGVVARAADDVARTPSAKRIQLRDGKDERIGDASAALAQHGFAGMLFMMPGFDSTLRANGAARCDGDAIEVEVGEAYVHCPKAFVRSKLWGEAGVDPGGWAPEHGPALGAAGRRFVEQSPFALLGTALEDGEADVSPRGDPPGFVQVVDERTLLLPDRPGNRIADSFRNVLAHPSAGLLFLIPGVAWALRVTGHARITADADRLAPMAVKGRAPRLGIWIDIQEAVLESAPALAGIWDPSRRTDADQIPTAGRAIVQQVEPQGRFLSAKGRVLDWMLARDAKTNLY